VVLLVYGVFVVCLCVNCEVVCCGVCGECVCLLCI